MSEEPVEDSVRATCEAYVGRQRTVEDSMSTERGEKLATILSAAWPQSALPPTWHWAYFSRAVPLDEVGADGHERLGVFMPPAPFARRMWASGEVSFERPLRMRVPARRVSTIADVAFKRGSTGPLCFVTLRHEILQDGRRVVDERQTVVYRDRQLSALPAGRGNEPVPEGYFDHPDTMLVGYSAVTHNGHRIHWDRDFCRDVEGYPGLVVHGPLMATRLYDAMSSALSDEFQPCRFAFRALAPVFDFSPVRVVVGRSGLGSEGRIERLDGVVAMKASLHPI